ncbi:unnamed protein product [Brassica oleracea]
MRSGSKEVCHTRKEEDDEEEEETWRARNIGAIRRPTWTT